MKVDPASREQERRQDAYNDLNFDITEVRRGADLQWQVTALITSQYTKDI